MEQQQGPVVAIDLGSNSFHLLKASLDSAGNLLPQLALVRKVQLALDMAEDGLSDAAVSRGLACLREFAPHCRALAADRVMAVGTQALRVASNRDRFLVAAEELLGHPVEVIDGGQEARFAYLGVTADPQASRTPLVVDIGGASTELIAGSGAGIEHLASLPLGCVSWLCHFPAGAITADHLDQARRAAIDVLQPVLHQFRGDWLATGCSGTLLAVAEVLRQNGWSDGYITSPGLAQLRQSLLQFDHIEAVHYQGLQESRRNIFASGVAIVSALFEALQLQRMAVSNYGLREGVAWHLLKAR